MKNYDEFISQVSIVPDFPQNIYGKVRFRVAVDKIKLPAATAFLFLMFAGIISFSTNIDKQPLDWNFASEEIIFANNMSYYSLFDE